MSLTFDPVLHLYTLNGTVLASVTQVLSRLGITAEYPLSAARSASKGSAIHEACAALDEDDYDESQTSDELIPYVRCYEKFKIDFNFQPHLIEQPLASEEYMFAGTIDRVGSVTKDGCTSIVVVDIKTGRSAPWHVLQVELYKLLAEQNGYDIDGALLLYLMPPNRYKIVRPDGEDKEAAQWIAKLWSYLASKNLAFKR